MNYQLISNICLPGEHGKQYLWVAEMYGLESLDTANYEFYQLLDKFY
jgi:hypothetical protein